MRNGDYLVFERTKGPGQAGLLTELAGTPPPPLKLNRQVPPTVSCQAASQSDRNNTLPSEAASDTTPIGMQVVSFRW